MKNNKLRQSGLKIMANLVLLLGNFAYFLIFAVINGVLGFIIGWYRVIQLFG